IPGTGLLPATVPGAFGAWLAMLSRYGTMHLREVAEPAIGYARGGYPLVAQAAATIAGVAPIFTEHWTSSAEIYLPGGRPPGARQRFANPVLADTLERLVAEGEAPGRVVSSRSRALVVPSTPASWQRRSTRSAPPSRWTARWRARR